MVRVKSKSISLTESIQVNEGSHILYFYESEEKYLQNLLSFILEAKHNNQQVVLLESDEVFEVVRELFGARWTEMELDKMIHFENNLEFYFHHGHFHFERTVEKFKDLVQPFVDGEVSIRLWGKITSDEIALVRSDLRKYEEKCDLTISDMGYVTVCVYDGNTLPAAIQSEMMRTHPYLMTDSELVKSPLYNHKDEVVFPSLASQKKIESELDLYRQKLDFVHVIAHEVRNPLTVIKSFASIIKSEVEEDSIQKKLGLIEDYAVAIDHEINHIIETEQMLTADGFWKVKLVQVLPILEEVVDSLTVKARTQNIRLETGIDVPLNTLINANVMGLRLIISNLLSNAIKYSHENGVVRLESYVGDGDLHIRVLDHGVGMSKEDLGKLFDKYQKLNDEVSGQGIGMFMVYKLVNHFRGRIDVISELGVGTEVHLRFPV